MEIFRTQIILLLALFFCSTGFGGTYSGGSGTAADPYRIGTAANWVELTAASGDWGKQFVLTADIDLTGIEVVPIATSTGPFIDRGFTGNLDGKGYVLRNAVINKPSNYYVGLFGYIRPGSRIQNLRLENILVFGSVSVGGLSGYNGGTVNTCIVSGSINGTNDVGGLIGTNSGGITSCSSQCNITASGKSVGGLVGSNNGASIVTSQSQSHVVGNENVGGLIGTNSGGITSCSSSGTVEGNISGGLVGKNNHGTLDSCKSDSHVNGGQTLGGLVGFTSGYIKSCYSTGTVAGSGNEVGGLVGNHDYGTIASCYSTGTVSSGGDDIGGLVGKNADYTPRIKSCFWDVELSGQNVSAGGGRGLSTVQMKTASIFQNFGWANQGWTIEDGVDSPHLAWEGTPGVPVGSPLPIHLSGNGTIEEPYRVTTAEEFAFLSWHIGLLNKAIELTADLDLNGQILYPFGDQNPFIGIFDGKGFTVANGVLYGPKTDNMGLFGVIEKNGCVRNLGVINIQVAGDSNVGGLAGSLHLGQIVSCFSQGTITGRQYVGGLVGGHSSGIITSCYSRGVVSGVVNVGGLVGSFFGGGPNVYQILITDCYSACKVTGSGDFVGGLSGRNYYAPVIACFWDIEVSGQTLSGNGRGLPTNQMKQASTFQNAGWSGKGWVIQDGMDYPHLAWEDTPGNPIGPLLPMGLTGQGTEEDPFRVTSAEEFLLLSRHVGVLDQHIVLTTDLDLSGMDLEPIGDLGPFIGTLDGQGHTIDNVTLQRPTSNGVGLFSYLGSGGRIQNLIVDHCRTSGYTSVGGLVGTNISGRIQSCSSFGTVVGHVVSIDGVGSTGGLVGGNFGILDSCFSDIQVECEDWGGGLIGTNYGEVISCSSNSIVLGGYHVGGLVGINSDSGIITSCSAKGQVHGRHGVGGLAGHNGGLIERCISGGPVIGEGNLGGLVGDTYEGTITQSGCTGSATGTSQNIGGLIGVNLYGTITLCFSTGAVKGGDICVGGLVGQHDEGAITTSYSTGSVEGTSKVGGLVGYSEEATITGCYSTGFVKGTGECLGGLVGIGNAGKPTNSYWDIETSGTTVSYGGSGKSTAQMKIRSTFGPGWDFSAIWTICERTNYPRLKWQIPTTDWVCPDGVGLEDLLYLGGRWLATTPAGVGAADANGDGKVGLQDMAILAENWMR